MSILNNIGFVYSALGEKQKALDFYNQALPLRRAVGDKVGEATTLNNIGRVYYAQGDVRKALKYVSDSVDILHELGELG
ncbi:MAG: tetratricopeptide repeat protein [Caldilineaceae bacterium]